MADPAPFRAPATPLPCKAALVTRDLDLARDHIGRVFVAHGLAFHERGHERGQSLRFRHSTAALRGISLHGLQYGATVAVTAPPLQSFYLLQYTVRGRCQISWGKHSMVLPAGSIFVMNPDTPYRKIWTADSRQLIVRLDAQGFRDYLADALPFRREAPLRFAAELIDGATDGASLLRHIASLCRDLGDRYAPLTQHRIERQLAESLIALVLHTMPHSLAPDLASERSTATPYYVHRAEAFMAAHARDDLTLGEIAKAAGVSARALHRGFRAFRDTTPMAHLKALRLQAARHDLTRQAGHAAVGEIAAANGFPHHGRFAREYRSRFGESPSATLRRSRGL
jgi:AraC-like DNA-binding protein